jgi:hypothetical protein
MDEMFWDEIERAREMTGAERMSESLDLFDAAISRAMSGIRLQFPGVSDEDAQRILRERLDRIRGIESLP